MPLINPQRGIFKPRQTSWLLSIRTVFPRSGARVWVWWSAWGTPTDLRRLWGDWVRLHGGWSWGRWRHCSAGVSATVLKPVAAGGNKTADPYHLLSRRFPGKISVHNPDVCSRMGSRAPWGTARLRNVVRSIRCGGPTGCSRASLRSTRGQAAPSSGLVQRRSTPFLWRAMRDIASARANPVGCCPHRDGCQWAVWTPDNLEWITALQDSPFGVRYAPDRYRPWLSDPSVG